MDTKMMIILLNAVSDKYFFSLYKVSIKIINKDIAKSLEYKTFCSPVVPQNADCLRKIDNRNPAHS